MTAALLSKTRPRPVRPRAKRQQYVPLQQRSVETRREIVLAATTSFRDKGYKATTLRDIARSAGIGAGSFYYYFGSKEKLLREVLDKGIANVNAAVRDAVNALPKSSTPLMRLQEAIRAGLRAILDANAYSTADTRIYNQLPRNLKRRDHPQRIAYVNYWRELVRQAQRQAEVRRDLDVSIFVDFLLGAISRAADWYDPNTVGIEQLADWIADWTFNGVGAGRPALALRE